jgi:hypothetical protein
MTITVAHPPIDVCLWGVKRTLRSYAPISAFDPIRTAAVLPEYLFFDEVLEARFRYYKRKMIA